MDHSHQKIEEARQVAKEAIEENAALKEQVRLLKDLLAKVSGAGASSPTASSANQTIEKGLLQEELSLLELQNKRHQQRIDKLVRILEEKEKEIEELAQYPLSFRKVSAKNRLLEEELQTSRGEISGVQGEKRALNEELQDVKKHCDQLEKGIEFLREKLEGAQIEVQQLQAALEESQGLIEEQREDLETSLEKNRLAQDIESELIALKSQFEQLRSKATSLMESHHTSEAQSKLEKARADQLHKTVIQLEEELRVKSTTSSAAQHELANIQTVLGEQGADLKEAKQHLAKKMKMLAAFQSKLEEKEETISRLSSDQERLSQAYSNIQANLEKQIRNEKELRNQQLEVEGQNKKLKEQMHLLQKKNSEFRDLNIKHQELKTLLNTLQGCMEEAEAEPESESESEQEFAVASTPLERTLFDAPSDKVQFKHTLFE